MDAVIGTAGWSIPRSAAAAFPDEGSALARYAQRFRGVEVNSSFYRPHRPATWARWADSVPEHFRFSVKMPKTITHQAKLVDADALVARFVEDIAPLGGRLAVLLVQLPPKLAFDRGSAGRFFTMLGGMAQADIACEPRHASWFDAEADDMLRRLRVARVAADPALSPAAAMPGGWCGLAYWRLHGSPVMYRSAYDDATIAGYAGQIAAALARESAAWCIFDNTAGSAAAGNALSLAAALRAR